MPDFDPRWFRDACGLFGTGVTVVTTHHDDEDHGMTANAFMSVSLDPPLIAVSIAERARMRMKLLAARRFAVSVLAEGMEDVAWHFAGKPRPHLANLFDRRDELPVIRGAVASFVADLDQAVPAGDHTISIGRVLSIASDPALRPLLFYRGQFTRSSHGLPHAAPAELLENVAVQIW